MGTESKSVGWQCKTVDYEFKRVDFKSNILDGECFDGESSLLSIESFYILIPACRNRIAANPDFRGQTLVGQIVEWAKNYVQENEK